MSRAVQLERAGGADDRRSIDGLGVWGVVPLIELPTVDAAEPVAAALLDAGLACAEVALRTDAAIDGIRRIRAAYPSMYLGAGTVLTVSQLDIVVGEGVDFVVTPGFNPTVVDRCLELGIPILPGVATPTEIDMALQRGIATVKLFPAEALGGVAYLQAIAAPYRAVRFVPTGGVSPANLADYLAISSVLACGGSWIAKPDVLRQSDFAKVRRLAMDALSITRGARPWIPEGNTEGPS
jgi:2-dehydro-3-deoxyphosphogluconate aldolase / (4S)-4-hydroxy-2-oxoglutarate aldolase